MPIDELEGIPIEVLPGPGFGLDPGRDLIAKFRRNR